MLYHLWSITLTSILDDNYNSNIEWVDVNGRCNYVFGASYRHHYSSIFHMQNKEHIGSTTGLATWVWFFCDLPIYFICIFLSICLDNVILI